MNQKQYLMFMTQQRSVCKICFQMGRRYAPSPDSTRHLFHHESMLIGGTRAMGLRENLPGGATKMGTPLYFQRAYHSLVKHLREEHPNHPMVIRFLGAQS